MRFVIGDPDSPVTRAREEIESAAFTISTRIKITLDQLASLRDSGVEARIGDRHVAMSLFQFDHDMLVSLHVADQLGHASPTLHVRRRQPGGLHDRLAGHLEYLWESARPMWPTDPATPRTTG